MVGTGSGRFGIGCVGGVTGRGFGDTGDRPALGWKGDSLWCGPSLSWMVWGGETGGEVGRRLWMGTHLSEPWLEVVVLGVVVAVG